MPTEEYTIKINTVLGSTTGITQATKAMQQASGQMAVQAGQQMGVAVQSGMTQVINNMKKQQGGTGGIFGGQFGKGLNIAGQGAQNLATGNGLGLLGMLGKGAGIAGLLTAAGVIGQGVMVTNTMANGGLSGGNGLRGQGILGTMGSIKDWWTGRSAREGIEDLHMSQNEFYRQSANRQTESYAQRELRSANVAFDPITNANQFDRAREERAQLERRKKDMMSRRDAVSNYAEIQRRNIAAGRFTDLNTGQNISAAMAAQQQADAMQQVQRMNEQVEGIQGQKRDFEFGQKAMRRDTLKSGMEQFANMLPADRWFARDAFAKAKAGQQVSPAELQAMKGIGIGAEFTQQYEQSKAMNEGFGEFAAAVGDPTYAKAAKLQMQFGGKIEHHLDENQLAQMEQKQLQDLTDAGNKVIQQVTDRLTQAGIITNEVMVNRKLITDRTQPSP